MKRPMTLAVCAILVITLGFGAVAWWKNQHAPGAGPAGKPTAGGAPARAAVPSDRFKALIVGVSGCRDDRLPQLKYAVSSARSLRDALKSIGYDATLYSDLAPENETAPTADNVMKWLENHADPSKADLVLLAVVGHGGLRNGEEYFLTSEATGQQGGLRLSDIDAKAAAGKWNLVMIVDACRTDLEVTPLQRLPGPQPDPAIVALKTGGKMTRNILVAPDAQTAPAPGRIPCTKLYATLYGKTAVDAKEDLASALASGLKIVDGRFLADPNRSSGGGDTGETVHPLALSSWFSYAIYRVNLQHDLVWQPVPIQGRVDFSEWVAQANPAGTPRLGIVAASNDIDLLEHWRPEHGMFRFEQLADSSWQISTRPDGVRESEPWVGGFVHQKGDGFSTTGREVLAEVVAVPGNWLELGNQHVSFKLDAKHVTRQNQNYFLSNGESAQFSARAGKPTWCRVRMLDERKLNYFGIADISPAGSVVIIRRLIVADRGRALPVQDEPVIDLMARWALGPDANCPSPPTIATEHVAGRPVLRIGPSQMGWAGGVVGPAPWVNAGDWVRIEFENVNRGEIQLAIHLKNGESYLGNDIFKLPPGKSVKDVKIGDCGGVNFIAVYRPTGPVRIFSMRLHAAELPAADADPRSRR